MKYLEIKEYPYFYCETIFKNSIGIPDIYFKSYDSIIIETVDHDPFILNIKKIEPISKGKQEYEIMHRGILYKYHLLYFFYCPICK
jgi:hypothetical protein